MLQARPIDTCIINMIWGLSLLQCQSVFICLLQDHNLPFCVQMFIQFYINPCFILLCIFKTDLQLHFCRQWFKFSLILQQKLSPETLSLIVVYTQYFRCIHLTCARILRFLLRFVLMYHHLETCFSAQLEFYTIEQYSYTYAVHTLM